MLVKELLHAFALIFMSRFFDFALWELAGGNVTTRQNESRAKKDTASAQKREHPRLRPWGARMGKNDRNTDGGGEGRTTHRGKGRKNENKNSGEQRCPEGTASQSCALPTPHLVLHHPGSLPYVLGIFGGFPKRCTHGAGLSSAPS